MDTIGVNYYSGWYTYPGYPDAIPYTLGTWLEEWNKSFGKPFFMSEYGAGAVSGMHMVSLCLSILPSLSSSLSLSLSVCLCHHSQIVSLAFISLSLPSESF